MSLAVRRQPKESLVNVPINLVEIPQARLNIENRSRTNLFSWNGQFSPQFVEALLDEYASGDDVVFDPFAGSGTTLYECARKGIAVAGTELNPSAYYMAKLYELCQANKAERIQLIGAVSAIVNACLYSSKITDALIKGFKEDEEGAVGTTLALLIVLLDVYKNDVTPKLLFEKWTKLKGTIRELPYTDKVVQVSLGDARHLSINDGTVDLVLTSPPYINVFNYHQNYRRSVECLGYDVLGIAKREFGSNRKHRGNRLYTVVQYCIDMVLALGELSRACKPASRMILVVGRESNVLGYSFYNSDLVFRICEEALGLSFLLRQERVFKNRFGQLIYEDILHFENTKHDEPQESILTESARGIARDALMAKIDQGGNKNRDLLALAIDNIDGIMKSEDCQ